MGSKSTGERARELDIQKGWLQNVTRVLILVALLTLNPSAQADTVRIVQLQNCVPGSNPEQRQRCDDAISEQLRSTSRTTQLDQGWRLVATTEPGGRGEAVSVMHTVDSAKSDLGLAGLSLRCGRNGGTEIVLVMLDPTNRSTPPKVALTTVSGRKEFETTVASGGEALLLPPAALSLAMGDWLTATEVSVEVMASPNPVRGVVPIGGLQAALHALAPHCTIR
jgi:hypothetical protein